MYVVVFSELKVVMLIESSYYQFLFKYYAKCNASQNSPTLHVYIHEHTTLDVESRGGAEFATPLPFGT